MATVQIIKKEFKNEETGRVIEYERLAIIGAIDGLPYTLELKLNTSELIAAKMLLASKSEPRVESHQGGEDVPVRRVKHDDDLGDLLD